MFKNLGLESQGKNNWADIYPDWLDYDRVWALALVFGLESGKRGARAKLFGQTGGKCGCCSQTEKQQPFPVSAIFRPTGREFFQENFSLNYEILFVFRFVDLQLAGLCPLDCWPRQQFPSLSIIPFGRWDKTPTKLRIEAIDETRTLWRFRPCSPRWTRPRWWTTCTALSSPGQIITIFGGTHFRFREKANSRGAGEEAPDMPLP